MNTADFLAALGHRSLAAGVLVILVFVAQRLFRRHLTPQWSCALWLLVVVKLLPFSFSSATSLFNLLPPWRTAPNTTPPTTELVAPPPVFSAATTAATPAPEPLPADKATAASIELPAVAAEPARSKLSEFVSSLRASWPTVLFNLWLAGVVLLSGCVIATSIALARRTRSARPIDDPRALGLLRNAAERLGMRRLPALLESRAVTSPALHGFIHPRLLLPHGFTAQFSSDELRFVFLHELAHVRRCDLAVNWLVTLLQVTHWFNPLVWFGFARWRVDREIACDALALSAAGSDARRDYGRTMLRLLETLAPRVPQPALVGILESKRQLARRMRMIASFTPARPRALAIVLIGMLAIVGLTDAQVSSAPGAATSGAPISGLPVAPPSPAVHTWLPELRLDGKSVVFLVSGAEHMLVETAGELAHWSQQPDEQKRDAPKWKRTADTLYSLLAALAPGTSYEVLRCENGEATSVASGVRGAPTDLQPLADAASRVRNTPPRSGEDFEAAFLAVAARPNVDRAVLLADGLPGHSRTIPVAAGEPTTEAQRIKFFQAAVRALPPRVPVSTILLPRLPGDQAAAGLYWELANATRGALVSPSRSASFAPTHVALVIDTSGSMRDPNTGGLWPIVGRKIRELLDAHPQLVGVQVLDGDGRFVLGPRRGRGTAAWRTATPELREEITRVVANYAQDSISNPVPGVRNALQFLHDKDAPDMRMAVYLLGDEFIAAPFDVLGSLDQLNPRDTSGRRAVSIHSFGFPTTIRYQFSMGNTGLKFANLMREIAHAHDGTFVALADL